MPSKRLPTDYKLEELLELVNEAPSDDSVILELNDVVLFLTTFEIKPGTEIILNKELYRLYKMWSKRPINPNHFGMEMAKYIPSRDIHGRYYYTINISAFKLSERSRQLIRVKLIDKTKSKNYKRHFEAFIKHYDLKPGKYWLESYLIFYLYDLWTYKKKKPLGEKQFHRFAKLYLKHKEKRHGHSVWYAVDESILQHLPQEHIDQIRESRKKKHGKKENKAKRSEIPSAPSGT
jgi:frataxin-like iron-binding protein CyaY